jgi:hypothetical protein
LRDRNAREKVVEALVPSAFHLISAAVLSGVGGVVESGANMTASSPTSDYALGSTDAEHERLVRPLRVSLLSPNDYSVKQALVQVNVSWISVPAPGTWLCWRREWWAPREKWWGWNATYARPQGHRPRTCRLTLPATVFQPHRWPRASLVQEAPSGTGF